MVTFFPSCLLYNAQGNPSSSLLSILKTFSIAHDGSWESILNETQKKWIKANLHSSKNHHDEHPLQSYELFSNVGMTESVSAYNKSYDYACIHGSYVKIVRERLWALKEAWECGVRFKNLFLLSGNRPLNSYENETLLTCQTSSPYPFSKGFKCEKLPHFESDMMMMVFKQMDFPHELKNLPVVLVNAMHEEGKPNTEDTLIALKEHHLQGSFLFVSSQPFIGRQDVVARKHFPKASIETIGPGLSVDIYLNEACSLDVFLDTLARWIYALGNDSFR